MCRSSEAGTVCRQGPRSVPDLDQLLCSQGVVEDGGEVRPAQHEGMIEARSEVGDRHVDEELTPLVVEPRRPQLRAALVQSCAQSHRVEDGQAVRLQQDPGPGGPGRAVLLEHGHPPPSSGQEQRRDAASRAATDDDDIDVPIGALHAPREPTTLVRAAPPGDYRAFR